MWPLMGRVWFPIVKKNGWLAINRLPSRGVRDYATHLPVAKPIKSPEFRSINCDVVAIGHATPDVLDGGCEIPAVACLPDSRLEFEFSTDFRRFGVSVYTKRDGVSKSRARLNARGPRAARKLLGANIAPHPPPRIERKLPGPCACSRNGADVTDHARSPLSATSAKLPGGSGVMA